MDEQAAPQAAGTSWWCRHCGGRVTLVGQTGSRPWLQKAVHAATGKELGDGGHLAAPIDQEPASAGSGLKLEGASR